MELVLYFIFSNLNCQIFIIKETTFMLKESVQKIRGFFQDFLEESTAQVKNLG